MDGWELDTDRLEEYNNYAARVYRCIFVTVFLSVCACRNLCERNVVLEREREHAYVLMSNSIYLRTMYFCVRDLYYHSLSPSPLIDKVR